METSVPSHHSPLLTTVLQQIRSETVHDLDRDRRFRELSLAYKSQYFDEVVPCVDDLRILQSEAPLMMNGLGARLLLIQRKKAELVGSYMYI
jgi:hypothetical protein